MKTKKNFKVTIALPVETIAEIVAPYEEKIADLKAQNNQLIKDAESAKICELGAENEILKKELAMSVVVLDSEKELKAYKTFCKKHKKCQLTSKANGGKVPYLVLNGTGVGACKKVVCQVCGKEQDITDISVW